MDSTFLRQYIIFKIHLLGYEMIQLHSSISYFHFVRIKTQQYILTLQFTDTQELHPSALNNTNRLDTN